jgi:hypothetical protein
MPIPVAENASERPDGAEIADRDPSCVIIRMSRQSDGSSGSVTKTEKIRSARTYRLAIHHLRNRAAPDGYYGGGPSGSEEAE